MVVMSLPEEKEREIDFIRGLFRLQDIQQDFCSEIQNDLLQTA